jgi:prolyl-tRNA synthetase
LAKKCCSFFCSPYFFKTKRRSGKIYQKLLNENIEVLYDDRDNVSPGEKFADADLIGCPIRLVVSSKTLDDKKIEFKLRTDDEIKLVDIDNLSNFLKNYK